MQYKTFGLIVLFVLSVSLCRADDFDEYEYDDEYENYDYDNTTSSEDYVKPSQHTASTIVTPTSTTIKFIEIELPEEIETICPAVCKCTDGTQFIDCSHQNLTTVPKNLPSNAIRIDLSHNNLEHIHDNDFSYSTELREILLNDNKINMIDKNVFTKLYRLDHIDLSSNLITKIDSDVFSVAKELTTLNLNFNPITIADDHPLLDMPELQVLNLEGCNLTEIFNDTFDKLIGLVSLNLANNPIKTPINVKGFDPMKNLEKLKVSSLSKKEIYDLCVILTAIDVIISDNYDISCFVLVSGSTFEESTVTNAPVIVELDQEEKISSPEASSTPTTTVSVTTVKIKTIKGKSLTSIENTTTTAVKTTVVHLDEQDITLNNRDEVQQVEAKNDTTLNTSNHSDQKTIEISSQSIKHILIGIIVIAVAGLAIGLLFRRDCFGIKTKLCKTRRPPPTDQVRPAEEVPLNKV